MSGYHTHKIGGVWFCGCQHFRTRGSPCRHILEHVVQENGIKFVCGNGCRDRSDSVLASRLLRFQSVMKDPCVLPCRKQDILLVLLRCGPCTAREIMKELGLPNRSCVSPRLSELHSKEDFGVRLVVGRGKKFCSYADCRVRVWTLSRPGRKIAEDILRSRGQVLGGGSGG